jgi:hypothetical protein
LSYQNDELQPTLLHFLDEVFNASCGSKEVFHTLNIIHLRAGSNWDYKGAAYHTKNYELVNKIFFG